MKILMVASEAAPYAKTGGLADVVGALPYALAQRGEQVGVVLPLYRSAARLIEGAENVYDRMPVVLSRKHALSVDIKRVTNRGVSFFFVSCPALFDRSALYGENGGDYADNHVRFAVLCRAALGVIRSLFRPDLVHCHDWQAGLVGVMMRQQFRTDPTYIGIPTLMTIHNLGYQGVYGRNILPDIGLPRELYRPDLLEFWGNVSYLKAGIVFADAVSTVSKAYAREIQTPEFGFGMDGLLRARSNVLHGILNGVDYGEWSPETDTHIAANYSGDDLSGKQACKRDLLRTFGLPDDDLSRPVIGIVSRFAHQKGFDILQDALDPMLQENILFTAIGSGEPRYEQMMSSLNERYPGKASVRIAYDNAIAHKIEAGADIFLMPSHYEPCGLNQIYSLRYGTVPIVRATGGLDDTIDEHTGFKFTDYNSGALLAAVRAALDAWKDRGRWTAMMKAGMQRDHSWSASAAEYASLYRRIAARQP